MNALEELGRGVVRTTIFPSVATLPRQGSHPLRIDRKHYISIDVQDPSKWTT